MSEREGERERERVWEEGRGGRESSYIFFCWVREGEEKKKEIRKREIERER